ncbi:DUF4412 domain-containing protein [uncultured Psychroserpens sp.]|uniref:DUF4412 domain-containing protein n=1 Tax=uncultured Psychroserpens sp. TaxID=255436 RepID=UPI0026161F34|nr:DUF4412 domain-containing protein [uncultured Psychroserpens sp.]
MKTLKIIILLYLVFLFPKEVLAQEGHSKKNTLPNSYDFEWAITMEMKTKQGSFIMDYYLKKDEPYFGFKNDQLAKAHKDASMFMVMDKERHINVVFMSAMGQNIVQTTKMDDFDVDNDANSDYKITEIGTKTIQGYKCTGFKTENAEHEVIFYVTNEVPVSFTQIWGFDEKSKPKGFKSGWMKYAENGLVMEMDFKHKKKSKFNVSMICKGIKKSEFSIDTTQYKSMF